MKRGWGGALAAAGATGGGRALALRIAEYPDLYSAIESRGNFFVVVVVYGGGDNPLAFESDRETVASSFASSP